MRSSVRERFVNDPITNYKSYEDDTTYCRYIVSYSVSVFEEGKNSLINPFQSADWSVADFICLLE